MYNAWGSRSGTSWTPYAPETQSKRDTQDLTFNAGQPGGTAVPRLDSVGQTSLPTSTWHRSKQQMKKDSGFSHALHLIRSEALHRPRPNHLCSMLRLGDTVEALCGNIFKDDIRKRDSGSDIWNCKHGKNGGSLWHHQIDPKDPDLFMQRQYGVVSLKKRPGYHLNYHEYSLRRRIHKHDCDRRAKCGCTHSVYVRWGPKNQNKPPKVFHLVQVKPQTDSDKRAQDGANIPLLPAQVKAEQTEFLSQGTNVAYFNRSFETATISAPPLGGTWFKHSVFRPEWYTQATVDNNAVNVPLNGNLVGRRTVDVAELTCPPIQLKRARHEK